MKKMLLSIAVICGSFALNAQITVTGISPAAVQESFIFTWADDWGQTPNFNNPGVSVQAELALVETGQPGTNPQGNPISQEGCQALTNGAAVNGKIAVIYRNTCDFSAKAMNAQNAGAVGVIILNRDDEAVGMAGGTAGANVTIPVVMLTSSAGELLTDQMALGPVVVFMGNKAGLNANDLASYTQVSLLPKYYGVSSLLSQNASEFNFDLGLRVYNFGTADQNNISVTAEITDPSSNVIYSEVVGTFSLDGVAGNVIDSVDIDPTATLMFPQFSQASYPVGEYTLTYTIENADNTDDDNSDNVIVSKFNVNNSIHSYARLDENNKPMANSFNRAAESETYTQCLPFVNPNASRIGVDGMYFQATTNSVLAPSLEGVEFGLTAYRWNDAFVDINDVAYDFTALEDIAYGAYNFGAGEEETPVFAPFDTPFLLEDNQRYLFCITTYSDSIFLGFDTDSKYNWNLGFYLQPIIVMSSDAGYFTGFTGADNWAPSLALNTFDATTIGIKETAMVQGSAYPNPAKDVVTISVDYKGAASLKVTDISGRTAMNSAINLESGKTDVNISSLETGMYIFNVTFENGQTSQFNVVKK